MNFFAAMADSIRQSLTPCILCHSPSGYGLCDDCQGNILNTQAIRCHRCGNLLTQSVQSSAPLCGDYLKDPPAFDATVTVTDFVPPVDQMVHMLKFQHRLAVAPVMGKLLYQTMTARHIQPDLLVAVPLGQKRLIERGFNQSHEIARTLGKLLKIAPQRSLLHRIRETERQSDIVLQARKQNVHQAFAVSSHGKTLIQGKHIAVVDDVMTTGSTLDEVARALKQAGAVQVTNLVFARTPKHLTGTVYV